MSGFNPETAMIGGVALPLIHMTIMSQLYGLIPNAQELAQTGRKRRWLWGRARDLFDLLNYPLAGFELLFIVPPWPLYSLEAWGVWGGATLATGATISATAKKILAQKAD